jgi:hypothetical protein
VGWIVAVMGAARLIVILKATFVFKQVVGPFGRWRLRAPHTPRWRRDGPSCG